MSNEMKANGKENVDFINISSKTENKLGRMLAYSATFNKVETLIGEITSLRTAMEYIITPKYPKKLLSKTRLTSKDINKIPSKTVGVKNFWAIATHLVYMRIKSDERLVEELLKLDENITFTSFNVRKYGAGGMSSNVREYNENAFGYVKCLQSVFKVLKTTDRSKWDDTIKDLIEDVKLDKDVSLFHGVPFEIEFNDV